MAGVLSLACTQGARTEKGSVTLAAVTAADNGSSLKLAWFKVDSVDGYLVYDDHSGTFEVVDTLWGDTSTSYTFTNPCTTVGVSTMVNGEAGDPTVLYLELVLRDSVVIYSVQDTTPGHMGYFAIGLDSAKVFLYDSSQRHNSQGYIDGPPDSLLVNTSYPLYTDAASFRIYVDTTAGSLEEMTVAPDPGDPGWSDYNHHDGVHLKPGDRFYVWVDECGLGHPGWSGLDLFGKGEVLSVNGYEITLKLKFQTSVQALRWMVE